LAAFFRLQIDNMQRPHTNQKRQRFATRHGSKLAKSSRGTGFRHLGLEKNRSIQVFFSFLAKKGDSELKKSWHRDCLNGCIFGFDPSSPKLF
jgi:hypothetical protein